MATFFETITRSLIKFFFIATTACTSASFTGEGTTASHPLHTFQLDFQNETATQALLADSLIYGSGCHVGWQRVDGRRALAVTTSREFSDAFINLRQLFGHSFDFTQAQYLSMKLWVPHDSWVSAMKLNFQDSLGNFGGCAEVFNNFYGHYDRWLDVVVHLPDITPDFQNWVGDESPLPRVTQLALNPYNAHQADSSVIYVSDIRLSNEKPDRHYTAALAPKPTHQPNVPYEINFDDEALLRQLTAYRAFESSYQALARGVASNETMAIRLKGNDENKYIAFLPILDKVTGQPVDFTRVKRLYFSYYLTEDSDNFDGLWLYLADKHWNNLLIDKNFYRGLQRGSWQRVSVTTEDLQLERARGEEPVLPHVYELRLDINYLPGKKNIEMWIDDFGWE